MALLLTNNFQAESLAVKKFENVTKNLENHTLSDISPEQYLPQDEWLPEVFFLKGFKFAASEKWEPCGKIYWKKSCKGG